MLPARMPRETRLLQSLKIWRLRGGIRDEREGSTPRCPGARQRPSAQRRGEADRQHDPSCPRHRPRAARSGAASEDHVAETEILGTPDARLGRASATYPQAGEVTMWSGSCSWCGKPGDATTLFCY